MEAVDLAQLGQQLIQRVLAVQVLAIFGGVLRHQVQLLDAAFRKAPGLLQDVLHPAGAVAAADQGNRAEAAAVVAALRNFKVGGIFLGAQDAVAVERQVGLVAKRRYTVSVQRLLDRLGDLGVFADAQHHIRLRNLADQLVLISLGQTAGDHQHLDLALVFELSKLEDGLDRLLLCVLDKAAGVDDDHIALLRVGADFIAVFQHQRQ